MKSVIPTAARDLVSRPVPGPAGREGRLLAFARNDSLAPLIVAAIVLPVALAAIDNLPVGVAHDDGMYVVLARALATGQGYHWLNLPGAPAATHYPPGYPALLAMVWRLFPDFPANVVVFKAVNALLLAIVAASVAIFARWRLGFSSRPAMAAAIAGCLAIPMLVLSTIVMSETFFLALLLPALLFAESSFEQATLPIRRAAVLGAIAGGLMLVRTHGVAFIFALSLTILARREWRALAITVASTIVVTLPWQLWQRSHASAVPAIIRGDYGSYGSWLLSAPGSPVALAGRTIVATSRELFTMIAAVTTAGVPSVPLRFAVVLTCFALLALGAARLARQARVTAWFGAVYLGIVLLWPFTPARFVWGIWPLVVLTFLAGALAVREWRPAGTPLRAARAALTALIVLVMVGHGVYTVRGYRGRWWSSIPRSTVAVAWPSVVWAAEHTKPTDVIATNAELMTYLYAKRLAVPATTFSVTDFFTLPSPAARDTALRSILQAYRIDAVAIVANDSLEVAARRAAAGPRPSLVLRDSVAHGLILTPSAR